MPTTTRNKLKTEDRQAELVQAALVLAAQRSPVEITTADLAQAIGITQGGVFKHFESKESIWLAVVDWAHHSLISRLTQVAQAQSTDAMQALHDVFMEHIAFVEQFPGVPRLIFQELQHPKPTPLKNKVQKLMLEYRALLVGLLGQAKQGGQLTQVVDIRAAAVLFIGAVQGLVIQSLVAGGMQGITRQAQAVFSIYEAGLLAVPKPPVRKHQ